MASEVSQPTPRATPSSKSRGSSLYCPLYGRSSGGLSYNIAERFIFNSCAEEAYRRHTSEHGGTPINSTIARTTHFFLEKMQEKGVNLLLNDTGVQMRTVSFQATRQRTKQNALIPQPAALADVAYELGDAQRAQLLYELLEQCFKEYPEIGVPVHTGFLPAPQQEQQYFTGHNTENISSTPAIASVSGSSQDTDELPPRRPVHRNYYTPGCAFDTSDSAKGYATGVITTSWGEKEYHFYSDINNLTEEGCKVMHWDEFKQYLSGRGDNIVYLALFCDEKGAIPGEFNYNPINPHPPIPGDRNYTHVFWPLF